MKFISFLLLKSLKYSPNFNRGLRLIHESVPMSSLRPLDTFGETSENSIFAWLKRDEYDAKQTQPRQITHSHFVVVYPEKVSKPYYVIASSNCAEVLGLNPSEFRSKLFINVLSGNEVVNGLDVPYATVYGCHCYGNWFGQLGDGRAMSLGEVANALEPSCTFEVQLKGCGRTPFSRGFDGRAVLRSCLREFLVSEAMHHLGVPTTRALSVIGTGDLVRRPWYSASVESSRLQPKTNIRNPNTVSEKFSPDRVVMEPGAVMCRVARSFLRFSHLEYFAIQNEYKLLQNMADYICYREFPHLLQEFPNNNNIHRYIELFRCIAKATANLVADWLRVGYVQGNMNSDNTQVGGRTIDYGPYGWMEQYDPLYQPFTSDIDGKFAFIRQPQAMSVNIQVLAESFIILIKHVCQSSTSTTTSISEESVEDFIQEIKNISQNEFIIYFKNKYNDMKRRKLGLLVFDTSTSSATASETSTSLEKVVTAEELWNTLEALMYKSKADFTLLFRVLSDIKNYSEPENALEYLQEKSVFYISLSERDTEEWLHWLTAYTSRLQKENQPLVVRQTDMFSVNPKYVLRNWMATLAYEQAMKGDYSICEELLIVLSKPYEDQSIEIAEKWSIKAPTWARTMPGVAFLS